MKGYSVIALIAALLLLAGCTQKGAESAKVVAGKAVYAGMGIEGAEISALAGNTVVDRTLSTYHGSFILHLPPGSYTLKGEALVPRGEREHVVGGKILDVVVGNERLDRITITMDGDDSGDR